MSGACFLKIVCTAGACFLKLFMNFRLLVPPGASFLQFCTSCSLYVSTAGRLLVHFAYVIRLLIFAFYCFYMLS